MQKLIFIGRLTKEVDVKTTQSGKEVANFSVAVRRPYSQDETDFFDVSAWGKMGENCAKYLNKGSQVCVNGYLATRTYEDNQGIKRKVYEVRAEEVEFLTPKQSNENGTQTKSNTQQRTSYEQLKAIEDDGLPF